MSGKRSSPSAPRTPAERIGPGWQIVRTGGDVPYKSARVRDETRIQAILRHVQARECVVVLGPPMSEKTHLLLDVA
jgi:hypothetical protein